MFTHVCKRFHTLTLADAVVCSSSVGDDVTTLTCDDLDGQPDLLCSIDFGSPEACKKKQSDTYPLCYIHFT